MPQPSMPGRIPGLSAIALTMLLSSCSGEGDGRPATTTLAQDTAGITAHLARERYSLEKILTHRDSYYAVIARRPELPQSAPHVRVETMPPGRVRELTWNGVNYYLDGEIVASARELDTLPPGTLHQDDIQDGFGRVRELLLLWLNHDSVVSLRPPKILDWFTPSTAEWLSIASEAVNGFRYTMDDGVEAVVGTYVFLLTDHELRPVYSDELPTCIPAELDDVDRDGIPEIIAFREDLNRGDCSRECIYSLKRELDVWGAWVSVLKWTGSGWSPREADFPTFYSKLAEQYRQAAAALRETPDRFLCDRPPPVPFLQEWLSRAEAISGAGR